MTTNHSEEGVAPTSVSCGVFFCWKRERSGRWGDRQGKTFLQATDQVTRHFKQAMPDFLRTLNLPLFSLGKRDEANFPMAEKPRTLPGAPGLRNCRFHVGQGAFVPTAGVTPRPG